MCVHNEQKYIYDTIKSILNQTFKDSELIIVNDGSQDNSMQIIKSFNDDRIKIINNNKNKGLTKSLNIGLKSCKGEYTARIDGNDLMDTNRLEKQFNYLNNHKEIAVLGSYFICINGDGDKVDKLDWPVGIDANIYRLLYAENPVGHPGVMIKTDILLTVGGYREEFYYSQDIDLWLRIYSKGYLIDNLPEYLTLYRMTNESISNKKRLNQIEYHKLAFIEFYKNITGKSISEIKLDKYLSQILLREKNITSKDIFDIFIIFYYLHSKLIKILNRPMNAEYYYNKLGDNFKLNKFISFKLLKYFIIKFPKVINIILY